MEKSKAKFILNFRLIFGAYLLFAVLFSYSCVEENPTIETFKKDMAYTFMKKDTTLSEFVKIIDRAGLKGMLNAYGNYTCLPPNNDAFRKYYTSLGKNYTLDKLTNEEILYIARTHIVSKKFMIENLDAGVIPNSNMNKRFIEITYEVDNITNSYKIMLNKFSQIISRDNEVGNGVVHKVNHVIQPSNYQLPELIFSNPKISIFAKALEMTGMADSLRKVKDENYKPVGVYKDLYGKFEVENPKEKKYGYTAFVESNELLASKGINNINDLIAKAKEMYFVADEFESDYTNRSNSLNIFISYHLVDKVIYYNKFFYTSHAINDYVPDEFIETMYANRLIRASKIYNRISLNNQSANAVKLFEEGSESTVNGVYHLLDNILFYSNNVENMLQNTRIRFDFAALFPELTNNNMRCSRGITTFDDDQFAFDPGYIEYVKMSRETIFYYLSGFDNSGWTDFQGDDVVALGQYDVTMRLLPVPPGTYELRFGYTANGNRSITQIYVDNKPVGIPLDLKIPASDHRIGYLLDSDTEDNGFENDKMMRNRGYMKGPNSFSSLSGGKGTVARNLKGALRRIIGTFTFNDYTPHTIRFRSVVNDVSKQMQLDYMEYVPKNVFNPADGTPESRD